MDNKIKEFTDILDRLTNQLLLDGKLIENEKINKKLGRPSSKYKYTCFFSNIIKTYDDAQKLLNMCSSQDELKYCILHQDNPFTHKCPICGKQITFNGIGYFGSCRNNECLCKILLSNESIKDNHQYIIDNYLNGNLRFNNIQIGFIEKFSVYNNSQLSAWKANITDTWKNKTKEELLIKKEKTIATCNAKYGCDYSQQNEEIKQKQRETILNKTDEEKRIKNEKRISTCIERYGVPHVMLSKEILANARQRNFEKYGYYTHYQKYIEHKDIYFDDEKFKEYVKELYIKNNRVRIKKTILDKFFNTCTTTRCKELGLLNYVRMHDSKLENLFKDLFDELNIDYVWRCRSIIDGPNGIGHKYELDFYLPNHNIGIEINDISNHNFIAQKNHIYGNKYHLHKTLNCKEKGIRLIHIWEWEIHKNFNKLSKWLINELNEHKIPVYARKCELKLVNNAEEKEFLEKYHLQGYSKSNICLGLYYENNLIQIMSFCKPRFSKKYEYELLRLCTKYDYIVIGGANKLFNNFVKKYSPKSIISYCDYSKFTGNVYENIGMRFDKLSAPTITYCDYNWHTINESILIKYGIDNLLGTNYGKHTDNKELIVKEGYLPVYNCGNLIYNYENERKD